MGEMLVISEIYCKSSKKFEHMKDEDIIEIVKGGNPFAVEYLLNKYKKLVVIKSVPYYLVGGDREDVIQEGMIGLLRAITHYDGGRGASFASFVEICIKGQIITAIKKANRMKHTPLNSYVSLNKTIYSDGSKKTLIDILEGCKVSDPMEAFINEEELKDIKVKMDKLLSDLEFNVFISYLQGKSYMEISCDLGMDRKCIDNALQRGKRKITRYIKK